MPIVFRLCFNILRISLIALLTPVMLAGQSGPTSGTSDLTENTRNDIKIYKSEKCAPGINTDGGYYFFNMEGQVSKMRKGNLCVTLDAHRYFGTLEDKCALFYDDSIVWTLPFSYHHEVFLNQDSNLVCLSYDHDGKSDKKFEKLITVSQDGKILKQQSFSLLYPSIEKWLPIPRDNIINSNLNFSRKFLTDTVRIQDLTYFHINSVQELPPNPLEKSDSAFKHGNYLISSYINNFMAIIDKDDFHVLWFYFQKGTAFGQHSARMLKDGRIIFLANNVLSKGKSYTAVRILNPLTRKINWEYSGSPKHSLQTVTQGNCQYLDNKNVLITINNYRAGGGGYAIEVTPSKKIVWKWEPANFKKLSEINEGFYRVERVPNP